MSVKSQMCIILKHKKEVNELSYAKLSEESKLTHGQLASIFKRDGKNVSVEKIEMLAEIMGVKFTVEGEGV